MKAWTNDFMASTVSELKSHLFSLSNPAY